MAELARRRAQALAPLFVLGSVALLSLLAFNLRNLDRGAEQLPPAPVDEPSPGVEAAAGSGEPLRLLYLGMMITLALVIVVGSVLLWRRGIKPWNLVSVWELLGYAFAIGFILVVFLYYRQVLAALEQFIAWVTGVRNPGSGGPGTSSPLPVGTPSGLLLVVAIAIVTIYAVVFAVAFVPRLYEAITYEAPEPGRGRREFAQALRTAIRDLEAGGDFRAAVLRCYRTMVLLFEAHGTRQEPSQTAREFEAEAFRGMGVSREGIDGLTSLFEEARYSAHPIGEPQRDAAVACLTAIRGQLEGSA